MDQVVSILDENLNPIQATLEFVNVKHKFSNIDSPTISIKLNGKLVKKNDKYFVTYKCGICNYIVGPQRIQNLTRRIKDNKKYCYKCKETNPTKRQQHSERMKRTFKKDIVTTIPVAPPINYFVNHFTLEEFKKFENAIISVNNIAINELEYRPCTQINRSLFFPRFFHKNSNRLIKPIQVKYNCTCCGDIHISKQLSGKIRKCSFLCHYCMLTNKSFKIKTCLNCNNENVTYQSKPELRLVKYCNAHNIVILDGPIIHYTWNNKLHKYKVDFYIPSHGLIEIKGRHIWHKKQVETGQWDAKELAAKKYCLERNMFYELIFSENLDTFENLLLRYSPNFRET